MPGPYAQTASQSSRFPFSSRPQITQAPLFYHTADEFREEDDGEEHQREVADFYALQRSRRAFGPSQFTESSEGDDYADAEHSSQPDDALESHDTEEEMPFARRRGGGIRSSWRRDRPNADPKELFSTGRPAPPPAAARRESIPESEATMQSRNGKGRLVDVELTNSEHSSIDNLDQEEDYGPEQSAPAYSGFHYKPQNNLEPSDQDEQEQSWLQQETNDETARLYPRPSSPDADSVLEDVVEEDEEDYTSPSPKHDQVWTTFYFIAFASVFATAFLVYLHTDEPTAVKPIGDTIYTILRKSYHLLAVDTLIAMIVAAVWLTLLRTYLRPLTYLTVLAVPIILFSFALWPFITSFKHGKREEIAQDRVMRAFAFVPFIGAIVWTYLTVQSRHSIERAIKILELASKVLTASPALVMAGFLALFTTVVWFWLWLAMFARVFLEGHMARKVFILDTSTWFLGGFFFLMLLWTQMVISGVQRATTAATVSQWYFYRSTDTVASSGDVVLASFNHATGPLFGSICLSSLIALLIRAPLIILPRRFTGLCSMCLYSMTPAPLAALTNPLTLTHAAIHSQPLAVAARGLARLPLSDTTLDTPSRSFRTPREDALAAYRTTHHLLHSTRQIMALALGLGAWVSSARYVQFANVGYTGSLYAYVVGLGAAAVGWGVLGAVEGILGGVIDAILVCWGSEMAAGTSGRRFCPEAADLFGEEPSGNRTGRIMV
jgi:hypothetical protein